MTQDGTSTQVTREVVQRAVEWWVTNEAEQSKTMRDLKKLSAEHGGWKRPLFGFNKQAVAALKEHTWQVFDTSRGQHTLVHYKKGGIGSGQVWEVLPGVMTPADVQQWLKVKAWYVNIGNGDMWVATAHGKREARRLALAELKRLDIKPQLRKPKVGKSGVKPERARVYGEGAVWKLEVFDAVAGRLVPIQTSAEAAKDEAK